MRGSSSANFLFLVRDTRSEGFVGTIRLGRVVTKWLRRHDRALLRLVRYFDGTPELGEHVWGKAEKAKMKVPTG